MDIFRPIYDAPDLFHSSVAKGVDSTAASGQQKSRPTRRRIYGNNP